LRLIQSIQEIFEYMLPSFLLTLREGLEAALIIGILFGALRKMNRSDLGGSVWAGVGVAFVVSVSAAVLMDLAGMEFEGKSEAIFEGIAMLLAAVLLTWMILWMQRQTRGMKASLEAKIRQAVSNKGSWALFLVAFLAVVREGLELGLYLLAARYATNVTDTLVGTGLGLVFAAVLGWMLYVSSHRLSLKRFFQITNILLLIFAAGLVGQGISALIEAGWIPSIIAPIWNLNAILPESSLFGQTLKSLFGYNAAPSLTAAVAYTAYLVVLSFILTRLRLASARTS
jgi:high-affinity iron transporter